MPRGLSFAHIDHVILGVQAQRVRMADGGKFLPFSIAALRQINDPLDDLIAKDAVVRLTRRLFPKQAKKHEYITDAHTLIGEMGLRGAALAKQARTIIAKHGIVMAEVLACHPAPACRMGQFSKPQISIGSDRVPAAGYR